MCCAYHHISLNVNNIKKIPIVFHNGSNYDHQLSKKT